MTPPDGLGTAIAAIYGSACSPAERSVLVCIVHAGDWRDLSRAPFLSTHELAQRTGLARSTVISALQTLAQSGIVRSSSEGYVAAVRRIDWGALSTHAPERTPTRRGGDRRSASAKGDRTSVTTDRTSVTADLQSVTHDRCSVGEVTEHRSVSSPDRPQVVPDPIPQPPAQAGGLDGEGLVGAGLQRLVEAGLAQRDVDLLAAGDTATLRDLRAVLTAMRAMPGWRTARLRPFVQRWMSGRRGGDGPGLRDLRPAPGSTVVRWPARSTAARDEECRTWAELVIAELEHGDVDGAADILAPVLARQDMAPMLLDRLALAGIDLAPHVAGQVRLRTLLERHAVVPAEAVAVVAPPPTPPPPPAPEIPRGPPEHIRQRLAQMRATT